MVAMIAAVNSRPIADKAFMTGFLLPISHGTLLERGLPHAGCTQIAGHRKGRECAVRITNLFSILEMTWPLLPSPDQSCFQCCRIRIPASVKTGSPFDPSLRCGTHQLGADSDARTASGHNRRHHSPSGFSKEK